jgi:hypothetical protein
VHGPVSSRVTGTKGVLPIKSSTAGWRKSVMSSIPGAIISLGNCISLMLFLQIVLRFASIATTPYANEQANKFLRRGLFANQSSVITLPWIESTNPYFANCNS